MIYADKPHAIQDVPMHRSQNLLKSVAYATRNLRGRRVPYHDGRLRMQGLSGGFFNKPVVRADRREPDNGRKRGITMAERKQITTKEYLAEVKGGLENELNLNAKALPENFNQSRFVLNCISLIKSN